MATTKLIPYRVRVKSLSESDNEFWNLTNLPRNPSIQRKLGQSNSPTALTGVDDFIDFIDEFCQKREDEHKDFEEDGLSNVTLALSSDWKSNSRLIEGNLYLGNSGVIRSILDLESGERDERGRDIDDAEERPIYFLLYTSSQHSKEGFLLLERSPRYGVKKALRTALRQWIEDNYAGTQNIEITPIPTGEIFSAMRNADETIRLRFERDGAPGQIHSRFDSVFETEEMKQATEFRAKSKEDMRLLVDELESWYNELNTDFEEINGQSYDNVKVTVKKNGSEKTISLTKGEMQLRKDINLSDITNEGDLPALPEISSQAHSFLRAVAGYDTGTSSLFK